MGGRLRKFIPYGFVQSMAMATLSVEKSLLGRKIKEFRDTGATITMYVDDIIISSNKYMQAEHIYNELMASALECGLQISDQKTSRPKESVGAFNCDVSHSLIAINEERMQKFREQLSQANEKQRMAILRYASVINPAQAHELAQVRSHI